MNPLTLVKRTQQINQKEASLGISDEASWHAKYKDSAYVFVGGVPFDLTEGDLVAVFAQYGEIVDVNLVRDKGTGKSKGFAFVAYEDQRSTNLAVDNLNGAQILGRIVRVDHCSNYKKKEEEDEETQRQKREARGVCRAFQKGECNRGASCKFSHDEQRAANTGWGAEEDRPSKWDHDRHEGPQRRGRQPIQSAHVSESDIRDGLRTSGRYAEVSKSKYESTTRDRHHDHRCLRSSDRRSDKVREMNYERDQDRSLSDRKSRRRDDEQMLSKEDYAKRDDKKFWRHESEYHRKEERGSRERDRTGEKRSGYDRESSPRHRRTDEDQGHRSHR